jgi:hypothetical protein
MSLWQTPFLISAYCGAFCLVDRILTLTGLQGVYYLLHALHNGVIVYLTAGDFWYSLTDFTTVGTVTNNMEALRWVFALHFYHVLLYWRKFRFDDWLHHALMIGVALPLGGLLPAGRLLGYSLFFTTGLPGGIDYLLLFLNRNNIIGREIEKWANGWLNVWVRSPGCTSHAALTLAFLSTQTAPDLLFWFGAFLTAALNYWNGQYFMFQVVYDAGERHIYGSSGSGLPTQRAN